MANTYTANTKLAMPAVGDRTWNVPVNGNSQAIDAFNAVGDLAVTTFEVPSTSLNIAVAAGLYVSQAGIVTTFAVVPSTTLTASTTNYVYLTGTGTLTVNTTGFPSSPTTYIPLATVNTGSSSINTITDQRACYSVVGAGFLPLAGGTLTDGANVALGTSTGTKWGTATNQKQGFFGKTPVVQPTMGAATAGSSYTSAEQAMLNAVYSAIRSLGLGS
jgi:hypothetical protein